MAIYNKPNTNDVFSENGTNSQKPDYDQGYAFADIPFNFHHNFLFNKSDAYNRHSNESGVPQYDSATTYSEGSITVHSVGGNGLNRRIYQSIVDNNIGNIPDVSPTQWRDITNEFLSAGYMEVTGTNTLTGSLSFPNLTEYKVGQKFYLKVENGNTGGAVTLNINGLGAKDVVLPDNTQMLAGDLKAGMIAQLVYVVAQDAQEKFFLLNQASKSTSAGQIVQIVEVVRTTLDSSRDDILSGNPLASQGKSVLMSTIAPKKIGNIIQIDCKLKNVTNKVTVGSPRLFPVATLNKIGTAVSAIYAITNTAGTISLTYSLEITSLASIGFDVRLGRSAAGSGDNIAYLNDQIRSRNGEAVGNNASKSYIRITEIQQ